jgi:hypothetical protein
MHLDQPFSPPLSDSSAAIRSASTRALPTPHRCKTVNLRLTTPKFMFGSPIEMRAVRDSGTIGEP